MDKILNFGSYLDYKLATGPRKRKGERTKDRLKWAAACVLDDVGYLNMRVADICDLANVSSATFYLYYTNKTDITKEVLTEFVDRLGPAASSGGPFTDAFDAILYPTREMVEIFAANAGIMRCLIQLSDEMPEFAELWRQGNDRWYRRIAANVSRRVNSPPDLEMVLFAVYAVGGMVDQLLRDLFVLRVPSFETLRLRLAPSVHDLSELLSILWYRALYAANPPAEKVGVGRDLLRLQMADAPAAATTRTGVQPKRSAKGRAKA